MRSTAHTSAEPTTAEAYAQKVRAEFGLRSDLSYIRSIEHKSGMSSQDLGTPLAPAEATNIEGRRTVSTWATEVGTAGERQANYAGDWIDQKAGGILHVATVGAGGQATYAKLKGLLPTDAKVSYVKATYSLEELNNVQTQLTSEILQKSALGSHIVESSVTPQYNAVTVALDPAIPSALMAQLSTRYGSRVRIIQSASGWVAQSSRDIESGPIHGGIYVSSALTNCTAGTGDYVNGAGQHYSITAGHCPGSSFYQGKDAAGPFIGQDHGNHFVSGGSSNCDCMAVGPLAASKVATGILVNGNAIFHYTHTASKAEQAPGTPICLSGAVEYETYGHILCGTVLSSFSAVPYKDGSFTLQDATITNITQSLAGDSGGPYGNGNAFIGIHAAQNPDLGESALTKAYNVAAALGGGFQY